MKNTVRLFFSSFKPAFLYNNLTKIERRFYNFRLDPFIFSSTKSKYLNELCVQK